MSSKVYFADLSSRPGYSLLTKFKKLLLAAGMGDIEYDRRFAAIKMHFGEYGNMSYIRPNYAKVVADVVKSKGGTPFLTDCNTLYAGSRKNALEHLDNAQMNGFNELSTGCHVIIADGLRGTEQVEIPVAGGEYVQNAKIGAAVAHSDIVISLTHFKGHESTGFGGAIKNLGMGCGSRAGKMEMHNSGSPAVDHSLCVGCGTCMRMCAHGAITVSNKKATIDSAKCVGCGHCIGACIADAIENQNVNTDDILCMKIAEYAKAVLDGKPAFHIALAMDISPNCDCYGSNDVPISPDIGMFASFDPVALDRACADAVNGAVHCDDIFHKMYENTDWHVCLAHCEKLGLGTQQYELVKID